MIPLIVIAGPTASGKTALAVDIAKQLGSEVVSADSMQIYKYMNIGVAKPTLDEMSGVKHHMLDFLEPDTAYSAAEYAKTAHEIIEQIHSKNKIPIMVGGTGLYIDSVVYNNDFCDTVVDENYRKELSELAEKQGVEAVYDMLKAVDPKTAQKYHPNNVRRVIRALEYYKTNGIPISCAAKNKPLYEFCYFCIDWDRDVLYDRINRRVDIMMADGLEAEAKEIYDRFYKTGKTAIQAIGYKELFEYFEGRCTLEDATDKIKQRSRNYAKRQLTWFKRNKDIVWLNPESDMLSCAMEIINDKFKGTN